MARKSQMPKELIVTRTPEDELLEKEDEGEFVVTRERIRQIEAKALRRLRHPVRCRQLRAFGDISSADDEKVK